LSICSMNGKITKKFENFKYLSLRNPFLRPLQNASGFTTPLNPVPINPVKLAKLKFCKWLTLHKDLVAFLTRLSVTMFFQAVMRLEKCIIGFSPLK